MKLTEQSELKMETNCRSASRSYRKISQANWWFGQMHRAVERACPSEEPVKVARQRVLPLVADQ
jgi:hypothetical protein